MARSDLKLGRHAPAPLPLSRMVDFASTPLPEVSQQQIRCYEAIMASGVLQPGLGEGRLADRRTLDIAMDVAIAVDTALEAVGV